MKMRVGMLCQLLEDHARWFEHLSSAELDDPAVHHWLASVGWGCLELLPQLESDIVVSQIRERLLVANMPPGNAWPVIVACQRVRWLLRITRQFAARLPASQIVSSEFLPLNTAQPSAEEETKGDCVLLIFEPVTASLA